MKPPSRVRANRKDSVMNRLPRSVFTAAVPLLAAACSVSAQDEAASSVNEKIAAGQNFSYDNSQIVGLLRLLDIKNSTLTVAPNGHLVFIPSANLAGYLYPDAPNPMDHVVDTPIPSQSVDLPVCGTASATVTGLNPDLGSATAEMSNYLLNIHVPFSGSVHLSTGWACPDFDVRVNAATIDISLGHGSDFVTDALVARDATVSVSSASVECSLGGWCSAIVDWLTGSHKNEIESALGGAVQKQVSDAVAKPDIATSIDSALAGLSNVLSPPQKGDGGWRVVPGSLGFNTDSIMWSASHWLAPAPPSCQIYQDPCTLVVVAGCVGATDPKGYGTADQLVLERLDTRIMSIDGHPFPIQYWNNVGLSHSSVEIDDATPPLGQTVTYRGCAVNPQGKACGPDLDIVTASSAACTNPATGIGGQGGRGRKNGGSIHIE